MLGLFRQSLPGLPCTLPLPSDNDIGILAGSPSILLGPRIMVGLSRIMGSGYMGLTWDCEKVHQSQLSQ